MPPRRASKLRAKPRRRVEWSPRVVLALNIGPDPLRDDDLDDATLRALWLEHREHLLALEQPGRRPWAFWRFGPEVPEPLRAERPVLVPDEDYDAAARRDDDRDLDQRRAAWLAEHSA